MGIFLIALKHNVDSSKTDIDCAAVRYSGMLVQFQNL